MGKRTKPFIIVQDKAIEISSVKQAEDGRGIIVRLFESTGKRRRITVEMPAIKKRIKTEIGAFEIKTLKIDPTRRSYSELNLVEQVCKVKRN